MKIKIFGFILLFVLVGSLKIDAQSFSDKITQFDWGLGIAYFKHTGFYVQERGIRTSNAQQISFDTSDVQEKFSLWFELPLGWNFPVIKVADNSSIGISPNFTFDIAFSGGKGLGLQIPVFVTFKYGNDATSKSNSDIGFTIGAGYQFSAIYSEAPFDYGMLAFYGLPSWMIEINLMRNSLLKLRYTANLGTYNAITTFADEYPDGSTPGASIDIKQAGCLSILINPNF